MHQINEINGDFLQAQNASKAIFPHQNLSYPEIREGFIVVRYHSYIHILWQFHMKPVGEVGSHVIVIERLHQNVISTVGREHHLDERSP